MRTLRDLIEDFIDAGEHGHDAAPDRAAIGALILAVRRQALDEAAAIADAHHKQASGYDTGGYERPWSLVAEWCEATADAIRALPVSLDGPAPEVKP